jgi:hypothetical protein
MFLLSVAYHPDNLVFWLGLPRRREEGQSWLSDHPSRQFQRFSVGKSQQQFLGGHDFARIFYNRCRRRVSPEMRWNALPNPISLRGSACAAILEQQ